MAKESRGDAASSRWDRGDSGVAAWVVDGWATHRRLPGRIAAAARRASLEDDAESVRRVERCSSRRRIAEPALPQQ